MGGEHQEKNSQRIKNGSIPENLVFLFFLVSWGARKHAYKYPSTSGGNRAALGSTKLDSLIGSVERLVGLDIARKR